MTAAVANNLPRTRAAAFALGAKRYYPDLPCARGHRSAYYTTSGGCAECSLEDDRKRRALYGQPRASRQASAPRGAWTTEDEIAFVAGLGSHASTRQSRPALLDGYREGVSRRRRWGSIDARAVAVALCDAMQVCG